MTAPPETLLAIPEPLSFLPWSPLLCSHLQGDPSSMDPKACYQAHQAASSDVKATQCSWFIQARKAQESRLVKEHTQKERTLAKQKAKTEEENRIAKKLAEGYTCRRCSAKFLSNTKLHEHIRDRHAKKPKSRGSGSGGASIKDPDLHVHSPKLVAKSPATLTTSRPSRIPVRVASPPTPPTTLASIESYAEIASSESPHLRGFTLKSARFTRPFTRPLTPPFTPPSSSTPPSSFSTTPSTPAPKPYLTMDDLSQMFAEKPQPLGLHHPQYPSYHRKSLGNLYNGRSSPLTAPFDTSFLSQGNLRRTSSVDGYDYGHPRPNRFILVEMDARGKTVSRTIVGPLSGKACRPPTSSFYWPSYHQSRHL